MGGGAQFWNVLSDVFDRFSKVSFEEQLSFRERGKNQLSLQEEEEEQKQERKEEENRKKRRSKAKRLRK